MPCTLVVSQPMFFPWIGMFEQVRLADVFVHYDDVQLPRGRSFSARVQIRAAGNSTWLTAPIDRQRSGSLINETIMVGDRQWRTKHLASLRHAYARTPHFDLMYALACQLYSFETDNLAEFNIHALEEISRWLGFSPEFRRSSQMATPGRSSERLIELCRATRAETYVTGLGALKYLDHEAFERAGISVRYMQYRLVPYPQLQGEFSPYVTVFDAIANLGAAARDLACSEAVPWRDLATAAQ